MWRFCPQGKNKILSGAQRRGTPYFLSFIYYLEMRSASCSSKSKKRYRCAGVWAVMPSAPSAKISIDLRGKAPGRGAYLCPSAACLAKARKAKRLERTFEVPIPDGIYDRLTEEIQCAEQSAKEAASDE